MERNVNIKLHRNQKLLILHTTLALNLSLTGSEFKLSKVVGGTERTCDHNCLSDSLLKETTNYIMIYYQGTNQIEPRESCKL